MPKPCDCTKCRYKCSENFTDNLRIKLCDQFYGLADYCRQKDFIINNVTESSPARILKSASKNRNVSRAFFLPLNGSRKRVCSDFFAKTLDIKLRSVQKYFEVHRDSIVVGAVPDGRGKHPPPNKSPEWVRALIRKHIESFPTMESHYCRASSSRKYLDSKLTIRKMYELFLEYFSASIPQDIDANSVHVPSEKVYRELFCTEYNFAFFVPKKDQCATCSQQSLCAGDLHKQALLENHIKQKDRAQDEKKKDKEISDTDKTFRMATFDMQSILQLPTSGEGPLYYKRKLILHNFTIYDSSESNRGFCYLWPETAGKRGANEIGSCLLDYLKSLDPTVKRVTFFSDSCSGQNRNQYVCALLMYAVRTLPIDIIDHKFLVPGHTMMECDSMHSAIEYAHRHMSIYSIHEWVNVLKIARRHNPYMVSVLEHPYFHDLKTLAGHLVTNRRSSNSDKIINWLDVRWVRIEKVSPNTIKVKTDFDQEEFDVLEQTKRKKMPKLKRAYATSLPISAAKYADLIGMLKSGLIDNDMYKDFYTQLPHNSKIPDLIPETSDDE